MKKLTYILASIVLLAVPISCTDYTYSEEEGYLTSLRHAERGILGKWVNPADSSYFEFKKDGVLVKGSNADEAIEGEYEFFVRNDMYMLNLDKNTSSQLYIPPKAVMVLSKTELLYMVANQRRDTTVYRYFREE